MAAERSCWQWVHHGAVLDDGRPVTATLCDTYIDEELAGAREKYDATRYQAYEEAAVLMRALIQATKFEELLAVSA